MELGKHLESGPHLVRGEGMPALGHGDLTPAG